MRHDPTPAERKLWEALRGRKLAGVKFHRQDVIGPFIADFYCASARLVIEVDGDIHDTQKDYDAYRTQQFENYGYRVIRFSNDDVLYNLKKVLAQISAALTPNPSPDSGGGESPLPPNLGEEAGESPRFSCLGEGLKHTDRPQNLPPATLTPNPSPDSGGGESPLPPYLWEGAGG